MIISPTIFDSSRILSAQSTRLGGVSAPPFDSLNMSFLVGDDPDAVTRNRAIFCDAVGIKPQNLATMGQVHGDQVLVVDTPGLKSGYDAQITNVPGIFLAVMVADCLPILLYDTAHHAIAAIHAGWRGTAADIVGQTLAMMHTYFGTSSSDCRAFIGAGISSEHYRVGVDVATQFDPASRVFYPESQEWSVDLRAANTQALVSAGVSLAHIEISPLCTFARHDLLFSHRHSGGLTGRMMAGIQLR